MKDIFIVGGGPVGLVGALAFAQAGYAVAIADRQKLPNLTVFGDECVPDARAVLISVGVWRIFERLGVCEALSPFAEPVRDVEAVGASGGQIAFRADDCPKEDVLGYMIEVAPLVAVLGEAVLSLDTIEVLAPSKLAAIAFLDGQADVEIDNRSMSARLLVGCDGGMSMVRQAAEIGFSGRDYPYKAVSAILEFDTLPGGLARQKFLAGGPVALLPLGENRANLVWTVRSEIADALIAMDDAQFVAELDRQSEGFVSGARVVGGRGAFGLSCKYADQFHGQRVALAGDAAHRVHPLAGQGLNLGLKDIAALVDVVDDAQRVGLDIGSEVALEPYTKMRRPDAVTTGLAMDALHKTFTGPSFLRKVAGVGMSLSGQFDPLRSWFAAEAGAVSGDLPSLMRKPEASDPVEAA